MAAPSKVTFDIYTHTHTWTLSHFSSLPLSSQAYVPAMSLCHALPLFLAVSGYAYVTSRHQRHVAASFFVTTDPVTCQVCCWLKATDFDCGTNWAFELNCFHWLKRSRYKNRRNFSICARKIDDKRPWLSQIVSHNLGHINKAQLRCCYA